MIPDGFIIHFPHQDSNSRKSWNIRPPELKQGMKPIEVSVVNWKVYKRGAVDSLYSEFKTWLINETEDKSRVPMCNGATDDDSNLWFDMRNN